MGDTLRPVHTAPQLHDVLAAVRDGARRLGVEAYLVGGFVRDRLLGTEGKGFLHLVHNLPQERLSIAAAGVAAAQAALGWTLEYAKERTAFGRPIGNFQVIRHKFAEMATKIETARQMVYTTAWRFQNGEYPVREITMAKLYAARIAVEVADECIQIHGGNGYMKEYGIERTWRDLRLNRIGAGTDEIMLEVIGRSYGL